MDTYKNFLLKAKTARLSQLQDTSGKSPVLSESCKEAQGLAAGAELRSPATEGQAPPGKGREAALPSGAAGRADAPAPRILRAAKKEVPASQPHQRLGRRPPPLTAAHGPTCVQPQQLRWLLGPVARAAEAGQALCYQLPRLPGAGRQPESTGSRARGPTLSGRGTPEYRGAHGV